MKITIRNRWTHNEIFSFESDTNTVLQTLRKAIESGADLSDADLSDADLAQAVQPNAFSFL